MRRLESKGFHSNGALGKWLPLTLCFLGAGTAAAQNAERKLLPPQVLPGEVCADGSPLRSSSSEGEKLGRDLCYDLPIKYTKGYIYNPSTREHDDVWLRSFGDRFVGPTIYMNPGQTVRMNLRNELPNSDKCPLKPDPDSTVPDCALFNKTNLHVHGLWISPSGNSDNVMLNINPGVRFQYEYNVPEDHPAGTFWYHPHLHGSTSVQVSSGMAGALIIKGDRLPRPLTHSKEYISGDIDTLLEPLKQKYRSDPPSPEVMLLQQIPYACFKDTTHQEIRKANGEAKGDWICDKSQGDVGVVENFSQQLAFNVKEGLSNWILSGRYTTINGVVQPEVSLKTQRLYRFRVILAGVSESVSLRIAKMTGEWPPREKMSAAEEEKYIEKICDDAETVPQWEVAADGLTRGQILEKTVNQLQPGYRSDVLVAFPRAGSYCVYDDSATASGTINPSTKAKEKARLLAIAVVEGNALPKGDVKKFVKDELLWAARQLKAKEDPKNEFAAVRTKIIRDLEDDLRTPLFAPHKTIANAELTHPGKRQFVTFNVTGFSINNKPYDPHDFSRTLTLGDTEAWELKTAAKGGNHPYHIHVNPFQIKKVERLVDGKYVDVTETVTSEKESQYYGMKDTWKDTLFVEQDSRITVYTRYKRYIGDFVLHCHILDHEDQGMMQNVRIALPDGKGGAAESGHAGMGH